MVPTIKETIIFWQQSANNAWKTANGLFSLKRYDSCLFFCHLTLEKILKSLVIQNTKQNSPFIHDLVKLATIAKLKLTDKQIEDLKIITTFNIMARYDNEKFNFYKKCTPGFTKQYLDITKQNYLWLKKHCQKK